MTSITDLKTALNWAYSQIDSAPDNLIENRIKIANKLQKIYDEACENLIHEVLDSKETSNNSSNHYIGV